MKVAVLGGGAAGFFSAISCKTHYSQAQVTLFEKSDKVLSKVRVSGGGRCNVTHACFSIAQLTKFYPRGGSQLKKSFQLFDTNDTVEWFESRGVKLKIESDNRMFPISDSSQTIVNCLEKEASRLKIDIRKRTGQVSIEKNENGFTCKFSGTHSTFDKVIIATGGSPKLSGFDWIKELGHTIEAPVPSLFTFNMPTESIKELMGVSVENVTVRIQGTKLISEGALLITHWGMSGPAILKLSAWGARTLHDCGYIFKIQLNWLGCLGESDVKSIIQEERKNSPKKKIINDNHFKIPNRLWQFLVNKAGISENQLWEEIGKKQTNQLVNTLQNDVYQVKEKTIFKEEFVTCGGVSLQNVDMTTMQSKIDSNIYFAGEVLDMDGITGGFNFQAAWTTGYIAGKLGG